MSDKIWLSSGGREREGVRGGRKGVRGGRKGVRGGRKKGREGERERMGERR